jgi:hypothetical protein
MTTTTSRRRRYAKPAALALAACLFGAAACGTETASDERSLAAPAPQAQSAPHSPMSADAAERWGASAHRAAQEAQQQYLRHLRRAAEKSHQLKLRRSDEHWLSRRDVPVI